MNLEEMTIEQLKVTAYDLLAQQEQTNRNLQAVNQMIAKKYEDAKTQQVSTLTKEEEEAKMASFAHSATL